MRAEKAKGAALACGPFVSVFARQIDRVVGKPERDLNRRKIGKRNLFRVDGVIVAVSAAQGGRVVGIDLQGPHLKSLGHHALVMALRQSDFIQQPVSAALVGNIFRPVCAGNARVQPEAIPMLAAGEVPQIGFGEFLSIGHGLRLLVWFRLHLLMQPTRPAPMSGEASTRVRKLLQQLFWGAPALAGGAKTPWGLSLARARAAALSATGGSRAKAHRRQAENSA